MKKEHLSIFKNMQISAKRFSSLMLFFLFGISLFSQKDHDLEKALILYEKGKDFYYDGSYWEAQNAFDSCLNLRLIHLSKPDTLLYKVYHRIANNFIKMGSLGKAEEALEQALENAAGVFNAISREISGIYLDYSTIFAKKYNLKKAEEFVDKAIEIQYEKYGNSSVQAANYLNNKAVIKYKSGDYKGAIELYEKILIIYKNELDQNDQNFNRIFNNLSSALRKQGDYTTALSYAEKALEIKLKNYPSDHPSVAKYFSNLAHLNSINKDFEKAEKNYNRALEITEKSYGINHSYYAADLSEIAGIYLENGDLKRALGIYKKAISIHKDLENQNLKTDLALKYNLVLVYIELNDLSLAELALQELESTIEDYGEEADHFWLDFYLLQARLFRKSNQFELAFQTLKIAEKRIQKRIQTSETQFLMIELFYERAKLASLDEGKQFIEQGIDDLELAVKSIISLRRGYLSTSSRAQLNERMSRIFELMVKLSLKNYDNNPTDMAFAQIFRAIELSKSASFWDNKIDENIYSSVRIPSERIAGLEIIKNQIADLEYELSKARSDDLITLLRDSLIVAQGQLASAYSDLEEEWPEFFSSKFSLPVRNIEEITSDLDNDQALVNLYINDSILIKLIMTKGRKKLFVKRLDTQNISDLVESISSETVDLESPHFYELLFEEIDEYFAEQSIKRIMIIPHRNLSLISFESIVDPISQKPLLYKYAFSYHFLASQISKPSRGKKLNYLGFAPDWSNSQIPLETKIQTRDINIHIPGAIEEVNKSSKIFNGKSFTGIQATEKNLKNNISDKTILHFATHASIDLTEESNSYISFGELVENEPQDEDGKLFMNEIGQLDINAELIILSACNTGKGRYQEGEGLMSHSRAFVLSGAKSSLMSLWLSNDKSANPIIQNFNKQIKAGLPKDLALQKAKLHYLETADPLMRDPYYWSGFVLYGDMSPFKRALKLSHFVLGVLAFSLLVLVLKMGKTIF